jgi:hypothetical protein
VSAALTSAGPLACLFRLGDFASAKWFLCIRPLLSLPLEVFLNLLAELLCVFIFGISLLSPS